MNEGSLLLICLSAFTAVLTLLTLLALILRLLTTLFPVAVAKTDAALVAALQAASQQALPGSRISRIEEIKS